MEREKEKEEKCDQVEKFPQTKNRFSVLAKETLFKKGENSLKDERLN
jgi:hypothetical protein